MERIVTELIKERLEKNRIVIIVGQRQVGKTWELQRLLKETGSKGSLFLDFEDEAKRGLFKVASVDVLESIIGARQAPRLLLFDEIQHLPKSGSILKLIHDHFPQTRVVATGSASFLLLKNMGDSLYGRHSLLNLYPLTLREIIGEAGNYDYRLGGYAKRLNQPAIDANLNNLLVYGGLPKVFLTIKPQDKIELLKGYVQSLLFKDVFEIEGIRLPQVFKRLLTLLAWQVGSEVSLSELSTQLEVSRATVREYISLYEKFQIVYSLPSFSRNKRKEIAKGFKVYFVDLGIRNAVIDNFNLPENRDDWGALFENLVVNLFAFNANYYRSDYKLFFWRSFIKSEVDLVLVNRQSGRLVPIEIKYARSRSPSQSFMNAYRDQIENSFSINKENIWQFI